MTFNCQAEVPITCEYIFIIYSISKPFFSFQ